jgi:2-oxopent-4-enoate hydratase
MEEKIIQQIAAELWQVTQNGRFIVQPTTQYPNMTIDDAYAIQLAGRKLREQAGHKVVGAKIGLTSKVMQDMFHVYEPDYGYIMEDMIINEQEPISMSNQRFPKVEAEIAFVLKDNLIGPGLSIVDVLRATEGIMPSLEIIDTRYKTFTLKIEDSVSDIASISKIVLGGKMIPIGALDLRYTGLVFEKNGEVISTAAGAAVLGHPAASVAWLANKLGSYGVQLHKGDIIMSGSFIAACCVQTGDYVQATFDHIGSVGTRFID